MGADGLGTTIEGDSGAERGTTRRRFIRGAAAAGAIAWTAPVIIDSFASPAAAFTCAGPCFRIELAADDTKCGSTVQTDKWGGFTPDETLCAPADPPARSADCTNVADKLTLSTYGITYISGVNGGNSDGSGGTAAASGDCSVPNKNDKTPASAGNRYRIFDFDPAGFTASVSCTSPQVWSTAGGVKGANDGNNTAYKTAEHNCCTAHGGTITGLAACRGSSYTTLQNNFPSAGKQRMTFFFDGNWRGNAPHSGGYRFVIGCSCTL